MIQSTANVTITVDGSISDWPQLTQVDSETHIVYGVYQDQENIFLLLKTADLASQRKIMKGLTVWYHAGKSKKKEVGLRYPINPMGIQPSQRGEQRDEMPDISTRIKSIPRDAEYIDNTTESTEFMYLGELTNEINAQMGFSNVTRELIYELKVPFSRIVTDKKLDKVTFVIESTDYKKEREFSPDSGMRASGGGMRGGGGMGGRPQGGGRGNADFQEKMEPISLTITALLGL